MTNSPPSNIAEKVLTLQINQTGWRKVCSEHVGSCADEPVSAAIGLDYSTVYRVRTGRLAPGPKFIAAALTAFGLDNFGQLFELATVERAA